MAGKKNNRTVLVSADLLLNRLRERGWSVEQFALEANVSTGTVSRVLGGNKEVFWKTAEAFRLALGLDCIDELISQPDSSVTVRRVNEWLVDDVQSSWITAANHLQYRIWKLRHEHLPRLARGKFYDMEGMSSDERERCHAALLRHAVVCTKIGKHDNIITNLSTCPADDAQGWWVIDEWVAGRSLKELLKQGPVSRAVAVSIGAEMAEALRVLHANSIVRRELTPQCLLIEEASQRVVLTEFELAKLLDGSPTVSTDEWIVDPYRAPEAESDDVDARADIYSWGRIMLELLLGKLPDAGREKAALKQSDLPTAETELLGRCLSISRRSRPNSFDEVLDELTEWTVGDE
ncbi:protein kinase [bacterium]|nr:protein kinase [bacterium]